MSRLAVLLAVLGALSACGPHEELAAPEETEQLSQDVARLEFRYFGGQVIANPKVFVVWWGDKSRHSPEATASRGGFEDFARGVTDSSYLDWLSLYHTLGTINAGSHKGQEGTRQIPGRGVFAGGVVLKDVPAGDVSDAKIHAALESAFAKNQLPSPDDDTLYVILFPSDLGVRHNNRWSCGAWTSYHDSFVTQSGRPARYVASVECGNSLRKLTAFTSISLLAALTNPDPAAEGTRPDYPQGWSTLKGEEISGPCQFLSRVLSTPYGNFSIQGGYDTLAKSCTVLRKEKNDFNVSLSPNTVLATTRQTVTVKTQTVSGQPQPLQLWVKAPPGVVAQLGQTKVLSGESTTLTLELTGTSASGAQVVVQALQDTPENSLPHSAAVLLTR